MPIDYTQVYSDLYSRAATAGDGAAVRALLGGGSSVFPAEQIGNLSGRTLPYLVWRAMPVAGASSEMRDVQAAWFAYVAPGKSTRLLHAIATELEELYGSLSVFDLAAGRLGVTYVGAPFYDEALALQGIEVRIGYRRLG